MNEDFIVIVDFEIEEGEQEEALGKIGDYIASFLSRQPGFIESRLLRSHDGSRIVHYARWASEADFRTFAGKAQSHPDLPALRAYKPSAGFFSLWATY